jgi:hypothetical protein
VATLAALRELFFGLAEICTVTAQNLTKSLDRSQRGCTSKRGINRQPPHWSHHLVMPHGQDLESSSATGILP